MKLKLEAPEGMENLTNLLRGVALTSLLAMVMAAAALIISAGGRHGN